MPAPPSEATDIAITRDLLSKLEVDTKITSPSKPNLDSFIAKDKARALGSPNSNMPAPPSEATDIAIARDLLSKCNLDPSHMNKENNVNTNFSSQLDEQQPSSEHASEHHQSEEIAEMTKKAIKRRNRNMRSRDKKERRSMHLVGSMVRVKLKKGRKQSRPPQSPASSLREFPTPQRKKNRPLI